jgi:hypothetical protein
LWKGISNMYSVEKVVAGQEINFLPNELQEPLYIIARIKGYENTYDYLTALIEDDIEMHRDGRADLSKEFVRYLNKLSNSKYR